jgi:hypothetical protein
MKRTNDFDYLMELPCGGGATSSLVDSSEARQAQVASAILPAPVAVPAPVLPPVIQQDQLTAHNAVIGANAIVEEVASGFWNASIRILQLILCAVIIGALPSEYQLGGFCVIVAIVLSYLGLVRLFKM